jgi:hypothetical protein
MRLDDHFGNGSILQRNERVKLAASFWNNIGAGMVIGGILLRQAARHLDQIWHCNSRTCARLAMLLNRQQHFDLYAHSAPRCCRLVMQSAVARGRTRKSPRAKNGGPMCLRTLAFASESGAPISPSSKRSIGLPTKSARSCLSRAVSVVGGPRLRATN